MRTINFQLRKQILLENISKIQNEDTFSRVENFVNRLLPSLSKFTKEELKDRIKQSEKDIQEDQIYTQEELEKESALW
jgi:hypothetical protein